jgi:hypothetical protein
MCDIEWAAIREPRTVIFLAGTRPATFIGGVESSQPPTPEKAMLQRNQAFACAVLSLIIALALVWTQFFDRRRELVQANREVVALQEAVRSNQQALVNTQQELGRLLELQGKGRVETREIALWLEWFSPLDKAQFFGFGASSPVSSVPSDRGVANSEVGNQRLIVGDSIILRPVIRAPDGNALGVRISVTGPEMENEGTSFGASGMPRLFRGEQWIFGDHSLKFTGPGIYSVTLTGYTFWPVMVHVVKYRLKVQPKPE